MGKRPKLIFFDWGNTLVVNVKDEIHNQDCGFKAVLAMAIRNDENITSAMLVDEYCEYKKELHIDTRQGALNLSIEIPFSITLRYLLDKHGVLLSISYFEAAELFWKHSNLYKASDGVQDFLDFLKEHNIRTAIITNNLFQDTIIKRRLDETLPDNNMEFIISSADYGFIKPKQQLFNIALQKGRNSARDAWHIGDDVVCDLQGASAANIYPVWYKPYYSERDLPTENMIYFKAENWQDIKDILK
jgi:putative hydrolase of the HAD superfamily